MAKLVKNPPESFIEVGQNWFQNQEPRPGIEPNRSLRADSAPGANPRYGELVPCVGVAFRLRMMREKRKRSATAAMSCANHNDLPANDSE